MAALARAPLNFSVGRLLIALCLCSQHVHNGGGEAALNSSHAGKHVIYIVRLYSTKTPP